MRGFKYIGPNGELIALSRNQTSTTRRYTNTKTYQTEVYSFAHPDYQFLELYRRAKLIALVVKSDSITYTEKQALACEGNLNRMALLIKRKGLELPLVNDTTPSSLQGAWMDDWVDWVCGDLNGPSQPPGWC